MPKHAIYLRGRRVTPSSASAETPVVISKDVVADPANVGNTSGIMLPSMQRLAKSAPKPPVNMGSAHLSPPVTLVGTYGNGLLGDTRISKPGIKKKARNNLVFCMPK